MKSKLIKLFALLLFPCMVYAQSIPYTEDNTDLNQFFDQIIKENSPKPQAQEQMAEPQAAPLNPAPNPQERAYASAKEKINKLLNPAKGDFRNVFFGWSSNQVKAAETADFIREMNGTLLYDTAVDQKNAFLLYYFYEDILYMAAYKFKVESANPIDYIKSYADLKTLLNKKYGDPYLDKINWANDSYKNDPNQIGNALMSGAVSFLARWKKADIDVLLVLQNQNNTINLVIFYAHTGIINGINKLRGYQKLSDL